MIPGPSASSLLIFAYPFLLATLLGWAWTLVREPPASRR